MTRGKVGWKGKGKKEKRRRKKNDYPVEFLLVSKRRKKESAGMLADGHDHALNLIGDSHEWRVIYPQRSPSKATIPAIRKRRSLQASLRPSTVPGVCGHCAKLCLNGDGVTLICLSLPPHTLVVRYRSPTARTFAFEWTTGLARVVVPLGIRRISRNSRTGLSRYASRSRRKSIDLCFLY